MGVIDEEIKNNSMMYASSVITDRALVHITDGLKPIHRRVIYAMHKMNAYTYKKCHKVSGEVMSYSPHSDSYPTIVNMAQKDGNIITYIDGEGNFAQHTSRDLQAGASRYCVTGDTLITTNKGLEKIEDIVKNTELSTENNIDINVLSVDNVTNKASKLFNSGNHPVKEVITNYGFSIKGTYNHPLLTLEYIKNGKKSTLNYKWKTIETINIGDYIVFNSGNSINLDHNESTIDEAIFLGGMIAEGNIRHDVDEGQYSFGFGNSDKEYYDKIKESVYKIFGNDTFVKERITSTKNHDKYYEFYVFGKEYVDVLENKYNYYPISKNRCIPNIILKSTKEMQQIFLKYLFEGDGGVSKAKKENTHKNAGGLFYSSSSIKLIKELQILLMNNFGIVMSIVNDKGGYKLETSNYNAINLFHKQIGFATERKINELAELVEIRTPYSKFNAIGKSDFIPFITEYINDVKTNNKNKICKARSFNSYQKLNEKYNILIGNIPNDKMWIIDSINKNKFRFLQVRDIKDVGEEIVYSIKVDSDCHSFVGNCMINHNTSCKLSDFSKNIMTDLSKRTVNMIDNYDCTLKIPEVLPVKTPNVLLFCSEGIAYGMASKIPSFNMNEVIEAMKEYIKTGNKTMLYPDYATGGKIIKNDSIVQSVNNTGLGIFRLRAKAEIKGNEISITEIPYSTTREAIIEKVIDLVKLGKLKEITDINDLTGLKGMEIEITCKKNTDMNVLLEKLYKLTPMESSYACNMNVINLQGLPKVMGVWSIIDEWLVWRKGCIVRGINNEIEDIRNKQHLFSGVEYIKDKRKKLLEIITKTKKIDVVKSIMKTFSLDEEQAKYIKSNLADILNNETLKETLAQYNLMESQIDKLFKNSQDVKFINKEVIKGLNEITEKFGQPRRTEIIEIDESTKEVINQLTNEVQSYPVRLVCTHDGYVKKMSTRVSAEHKLKDGDYIISEYETNNTQELVVFTNSTDVYKIRLNNISDVKPSQLGDYLPNKLEIDEIIGYTIVDNNYKYTIILYDNGKIAKIDNSSYVTSTNRKKLSNSLCKDCKPLKIFTIKDDLNIKLTNSKGKIFECNTSEIKPKAKRDTQGLLWNQKKNICKIEIVESED